MQIDRSNAQTILQIRDLHTYFFTVLGVSRALNGVTMDVPAGKVLGIVGESGCGKSVTALSAMRLVPNPGRIVQGEIVFNRMVRENEGFRMTDEIVLTDLDPRGPQIRQVRGADIAMIFQEPMTSLNPSYTIGNQIVESILLHQDVSRSEALDRAVSVLESVEMPNASEVVKRYPHELSGGMRQRGMIAMALSCEPAILIADEPTTALDVTTESEILQTMRELQRRIGMTIMFITHDLGVIAQMADEVAVMYLGRVVERAGVEDLFYNPKHPYASALLQSIPKIGQKGKVLHPIRGVVPDPYSRIAGCPFHPRCDSFMPGTCDANVPAMTEIEEDDNHEVRCFLYSDEVEQNVYNE